MYSDATYMSTDVLHFTAVRLRIPFFRDTTLTLLHTTEDEGIAFFRKLGHRSPSDAATHPRKTESSYIYGLNYILYLRDVSVRHVNMNSGIHYPMVAGDKTAGSLSLSLTYIYGRGLERVDLWHASPIQRYGAVLGNSRILPNQCRKSYLVSAKLLNCCVLWNNVTSMLYAYVIPVPGTSYRIAIEKFAYDETACCYEHRLLIIVSKKAHKYARFL
jgi:hypothetical protein